MSGYNDVSKEDIHNVFEKLKSNAKDESSDKILYFAGPWFTDKAKEFYDGVVSIVQSLKDSLRYHMFFPRFVSGTPKKCFESDITSIINADIVLAWVDEKDTGTAFEIGYAKAIGKKVYLLGYDMDTFTKSKTNLMLAYSSDGIILLEDLVKFLSSQMVVREIDFNWEVVE